MRDVALVALVCAAVSPAVAWGAEATDAARERATRLLDARTEALERQHTAAVRTARAQAMQAYRLARRRELRGFATDRDGREGHAADVALLSLRRGLDEARRLGHEREAVAAERARVDSPHEIATVPSLGAMDATKLSWPVRGTVVASPGARREAATAVEIDPAALEIMARGDDPVRAPAQGVVRRIETLADGRTAVVLVHGSRWVSVLAGLRGVTLAPWDRVDEGDVLGLAARNGDGAAVVTFALWRTAVRGGERGWVDPRSVLSARTAD